MSSQFPISLAFKMVNRTIKYVLAASLARRLFVITFFNVSRYFFPMCTPAKLLHMHFLSCSLSTGHCINCFLFYEFVHLSSVGLPFHLLLKKWKYMLVCRAAGSVLQLTESVIWPDILRHLHFEAFAFSRREACGRLIYHWAVLSCVSLQCHAMPFYDPASIKNSWL